MVGPSPSHRLLKLLRQYGLPALTAGMPVLLLVFWLLLTWNLPGPEQIRHTLRGSLRIKAADGSLLYNGTQGPVRQVKSQEIPVALREAVLATEDRRFFEHRGMDPVGIVRALVRNTEASRLREGGSTITQQLARNLFLTQERSVWRKLKEIVIAQRLEQSFSKEEILTLYLNRIYFGSGAYGVADAAVTYFNKPVSKLNLLESALLAGLPQAPSRYSPLVNRELARKRRDVVLKNMVEAGFLSASEYARARTRRVVLNPRLRTPERGSAYFTAYVQSLLPVLLGSVPNGLTVETTLDPVAQAEAEKTLTTTLKNLSRRRVSEGAIVAINPKNGEIRAMVGGRDFQRSQFNRAVQALRQPGSTFKVFVWASALEAGLSPEDVYTDGPTRFGSYEVKNYDRDYWGEMTLAEALKESRNTIAVQLIEQVGARNTVEVSHRMGIRSPLNPGPALALGASETTLLELTSAYGTLANDGLRAEPRAIRRIIDGAGKVIWTADPMARQALNPEVARTMTAMLEQVILDGTGRRANINRPAAGKTGTTEGNRDLLFVGYTPQLVTGVWLGNDDNSPTRGSSALVAGLWATFMGRVMDRLPVLAFQASRFTETKPIPEPPPEEQRELFNANVEPEEPESSTEIACYISGEGALVCTNDEYREDEQGADEPTER